MKPLPNNKIKDIDDYINTFPKSTKDILTRIRNIVKEEVPEATECISYQMPTFKLNNHNLLHFAGYKKHIGFYPIPSGIKAFKKELDEYKSGKGSVQFPLDKPIPYDLIRKIVIYRIKEVLKRKS